MSIFTYLKDLTFKRENKRKYFFKFNNFIIISRNSNFNLVPKIFYVKQLIKTLFKQQSLKVRNKSNRTKFSDDFIKYLSALKD